MKLPASLAVGYADDPQKARAQVLAELLQLPINNQAADQLLVTADKLMLKISPFLPLYADFSSAAWQKRHAAGRKQGLVRACKPAPGIKIIDATAGWGVDAAILASFGAEVIMLERNPLLAILLEDALLRERQLTKQLKLTLVAKDAFDYLAQLPAADYPHIIYLDPMHPERTKTALVKKEMQILQRLNGVDTNILALIKLARSRTQTKVVVKWPQHVPALMPAHTSIAGKTIRFDIYTKE